MLVCVGGGAGGGGRAGGRIEEEKEEEEDERFLARQSPLLIVDCVTGQLSGRSSGHLKALLNEGRTHSAFYTYPSLVNCLKENLWWWTSPLLFAVVEASRSCFAFRCPAVPFLRKYNKELCTYFTTRPPSPSPIKGFLNTDYLISKISMYTQFFFLLFWLFSLFV